MKILVTGNAGSGKSTISNKVSEALGLPLYGLDEIVWKENWVQATSEECSSKIIDIIIQENWVIDGVSVKALRSADFVVFIDRNPIQCALRAMNRNIHYLFKPRPGLPKGCIEIKIVPYLLKLIFKFNPNVRPKILEEISSNPHIILRTDNDVQEFLGSLVHNNHGLGTRSSPQP